MKNFLYVVRRVLLIIAVVYFGGLVLALYGSAFDIYQPEAVLVPLACIGLMYVAWRSPKVGGGLLIFAGLVIWGYVVFDGSILVGLIMGVPAFLPGLLLMFEKAISEKSDQKTERILRTRRIIDLVSVATLIAGVLGGAAFWLTMWQRHAWKFPKADERDVQITAVAGEVFIVRGSATSTAVAGSVLNDGDRLVTGEGEMRVRFFNDAWVVLDENTDLTVESALMPSVDPRKQAVVVNIGWGRIWADVRMYAAQQDFASFTLKIGASGEHARAVDAAFVARIEDSGRIAFDADRGEISLSRGDLNGGSSVEFDPGLPKNQRDGYRAAFTEDAVRNDPWFRRMRGADKKPILNESDVVTDVSVESAGTAFPVECYEEFQLHGFAVIRHADGSVSKRDVTNEAIWQSRGDDLDRAEIDKGKIRAGLGLSATERIMMRWDDGVAEHSTQFEYERDSCMYAL